MFGQPNKEIERVYKPPDIVKTIDIDFDKEEFGKIVKKKHTIKIMCFYDDDFNADRYSYEVTYVGGSSHGGGYGNNNEIVHPNLYHALMSAIECVCGFDREQFKRVTRDIKLNYLIDEEEL